MKKYIFFTVTMFLSINSYAQIRIANDANNSAASNSSAFIDASSNTGYNSNPNLGKGLLFPRVDLQLFTTFGGSPIGIPNSYPTRYDGMIVYNTASSGVAGVGYTEGTLVPGFWYYDNKHVSDVNGGTWRPLGGGSANVVLPGTWLYCPPFMLPWTANATGLSINLYQQYSDGLSGYSTSSLVKKTTSPTQVVNFVGNATEFDYLVNYSGASITIISINPSTGEMIYDCTGVPPTYVDFVSVVLIKK